MVDVVVYGTSWSVSSWDARRLLTLLNVPFQFVDLESDDEAMAWLNTQCDDGDLGTVLPVVKLADGRLLKGVTRRDIANLYGVRLDTGLFNAMAQERAAAAVGQLKG